MAKSYCGAKKGFFVLSVALLVVVCAVVLSYAAQKKVSAGAVVSWSGIVFIERKGGERVQVKRQEAVYAGDTVVTSSASRAKLLMKDDTILSLAENSTLTMKGYEVNHAQKERNSVLRLSRGTLRSIVSRVFGAKNSNFSIETATAVAGIKGTDFIVKDSVEETRILGIEGKVAVKSSNPAIAGEVIIEPGYMTGVKAGAAPSRPIEAPADYFEGVMNETELSITAPVDDKEEGAGDKVSGNPCLECHSKVLTKMSVNKFPHPKADISCAACHLQPPGKPVKTNIETPAEEGMAVLALKKGVSYTVTLKVSDDKSRQASAKPLSIVKGEEPSSLEDKNAPPVISNASVTEITAGLFYSAVVEWSTDKPGSSKVDYGKTNKLGMTARNTAGENIYLNRHKVKLDKLTPGDTYYMIISSEDVFGNMAASNLMKFKVDKPFSAKADAAETKIYPAIKNVGIASAGTKTVLKWASGTKVKATVEVREMPKSGEQGGGEPHYPGLRSAIEVGMDSCDECHSGRIHKKMSHAVGTVSWLKASKSEDLPYDAAGNMMCTTCHPAHGGNFSNMLRKDETQLCNSCHK